MATVRIGHAAKDEYGRYKNGAAGDQTGVEVYIRSWYSRPWNYILRANDPNMADKIAEAMEKACKNNNIGYDQYQRNTLLEKARRYKYDPSKVNEKCETDCSALVSLCCMYAGVPEGQLYIARNSATTGTLRRMLMESGRFKTITGTAHTASSKYLKRGDILLYEGHHVAVCLDDGDEISKGCPYPEPVGIIKKGSKGDGVKWVQWYLNKKFSAKLDVDGDFGALTEKAVIEYQSVCGLDRDGIVGPKTKARLKA